MAGCPLFDPGSAYVGQVLGMVDCRAMQIAGEGWHSLTGPGGFGPGLTALLTIVVALAGYRLLLGEAVLLRNAMGLVARIGLVLALATQWPAWDVLVYRNGTQTPDWLVARLIEPQVSGAGDRAGLAVRIDRINAQIASVTDVDPNAIQARNNTQGAPSQTTAGPTPAVTTLDEDQRKDLGAARKLMMTSGLAGLLGIRLAIALLLATGPLFVVTVLFDATRGLFAGWIRALAGAIVAAMAVPLALSLELAVIEPQVARLTGLVQADDPVGSLCSEIWTSAALFALIMVIVAIALGWAASAFRLPDRLIGSVATRRDQPRPESAVLPLAAASPGGSAVLPDGRSRAQRLADVARAAQRRDETAGQAGSRMIHATVLAREAPDTAGQHAQVSPWLGQSASRRQRRSSRGAGRRDGL